MSQERWTQVDDYIVENVAASDPVLDAALQASREAGLPAINVAPNQGKFLFLLTRMLGARRVLEIGTLGGYSTIWLGRALPLDGELITLEADAAYAAVAAANIELAGLDGIVQIKIGRAIETLPTLTGPFDLIFIDADKTSTPDYFEWALQLTQAGSVIIVDNVIRDGAVIDRTTDDPNIRGMRDFFQMLATEPRVDATAIQTVGIKGYDGFALALVV